MKHIPILDLKKQIAPIRKELDTAIRRVINDATFILGREAEEFEKDVSRYCNADYAVGLSNGTDAIRLSLSVLGVKAGDAVICPAFTYYATAGAIAGIGALPVFADIEPDTYNISVCSIEKILKARKADRVKAIIPVHLYGQCADMDGILGLAKKYGLKIVEDAAQAFGAEYLPAGRQSKGRKAGTLGDCGAVSFYPSKNLGAFGDAGMILTKNKLNDYKLRLLRNQGDCGGYHHCLSGSNNRLDSIQAAVLRVKLKHLDAWNKKRQENAEYFNERFIGLRCRIPVVAGFSTHIYHQYVLRTNFSSAGIVRRLRSKGIDARVYYPLPLHLQKCFRYLGYKKGAFPESEKAAKQTFAIPVYPDLTQKQKEYIAASVKEILK